MVLPPELVTKILTHLQDDKPALQNCSLVVKSWVYSSQKLLYTNAHLTPESYRIWRENVSPTGEELLQHVRTLNCRDFDSLQPSHGDYFGSLHHLERLFLHQLTIIGPNITNLLTAFQTTLSSLSLGDVSLTWGTFINIVDYFPNLTYLFLDRTSFVGDLRPVPPLSRPPHGKLRLFLLPPDATSMLSIGLPASEPRYDELEILDVLDYPPSRVRPIISACGKTLTRLALNLFSGRF
jgi:hypothetical protein